MGILPPPFATLFRPTIVMGKDQLIIGASTTAAEQAADLSGTPRERLWQPTGAFVPVMSKLPANLVYLRITDPRETMPAIIEALPILAQQVNAQIAQTQRMRGQIGEPPAPGAPVTPAMRVDADKLPRAEELIRLLVPRLDGPGRGRSGGQPDRTRADPRPQLAGGRRRLLALLVPATGSAREAARRAQCVNNLKQIGLANHNYHSANNVFPMQAITDKDGKPLLSWRVAILPYIEQQELYNKFKLDEPWDSPNNKPLIKEMPKAYLCPGRRKPEPGHDDLPRLRGQGGHVRGGRGHGHPERDRRDLEHDHGRRVEGRGALDQARRPEVRHGGQAVALRRRLAAPGRLQRRRSPTARSGSSRTRSALQVWKALITRAGGRGHLGRRLLSLSANSACSCDFTIGKHLPITEPDAPARGLPRILAGASG